MIKSIPDRDKLKYIFAPDTETHLIEPGLLAPPMVCTTAAATVKGSNGLFSAPDHPPEIWHHSDDSLFENLYEFFSNPEVLIVGANIPFDLAVFMSWDSRLIDPIFDALDNDRVEDVQTRQKLIDVACGWLGGRFRNGTFETYKYSLAGLQKRLLGEDRSAQKSGEDIWRLRYSELEEVPCSEWPSEALQYALDDATGTLDVYLKQTEEESLLHDSFRQTRAHMGLHLMSCHGMTTDPEAVDLYHEYTQARLDQNRKELIKAGLVSEVKRPSKAQKEKGIPGPWFKRNMKLAKARMEKVYPECKRTAPSAKFPDGQPSLDEDACREAGDELLIKYQEFGSSGTILNNVYDLKKGTETPIQTRFEILKNTGRTGSSGPNMQNRDRKFGDRECFIPRPGWLYAAADYDGQELTTLAQVCYTLFGHSSLGDALNSGVDCHLKFAATLQNTTYEKIKADYESGCEVAKEARSLAKIGNFGFAGGLGPTAFVVQAKTKYGKRICSSADHALTGICPMCVIEAGSMRTSWKDTWKEMHQYFDYISQASSGGAAFVEHLFSKRRRGNITYTECANTFFQGLGSDASKAGLWGVTKACYWEREGSILYGSRPVLHIHDENIAEVKDDHLAQEKAEELAHIMCRESKKWLPDMNPTATPYLMRRWSKQAGPVFNESGKMIPWDGPYKTPSGLSFPTHQEAYRQMIKEVSL